MSTYEVGDSVKRISGPPEFTSTISKIGEIMHIDESTYVIKNNLNYQIPKLYYIKFESGKMEAATEEQIRLISKRPKNTPFKFDIGEMVRVRNRGGIGKIVSRRSDLDQNLYRVALFVTALAYPLDYGRTGDNKLRPCIQTNEANTFEYKENEIEKFNKNDLVKFAPYLPDEGVGLGCDIARYHKLESELYGMRKVGEYHTREEWMAVVNRVLYHMHNNLQIRLIYEDPSIMEKKQTSKTLQERERQMAQEREYQLALERERQMKDEEEDDYQYNQYNQYNQYYQQQQQQQHHQQQHEQQQHHQQQQQQQQEQRYYDYDYYYNDNDNNDTNIGHYRDPYMGGGSKQKKQFKKKIDF
jgi:hypothetical protein